MSPRLVFRYILVILILIVSFGNPISSLQSKDLGTITINVSSVNFRDGAGLNHGIIGHGQLGETYPIISIEDNWVQIALPDGKKGWVASWLVDMQKSAITDSVLITPTIDGLNVRSGPSTSFPAIEQINQGEKYAKLDSEGDWVKIKLENGEGWIANWRVKEVTNHASTPSPEAGRTAIVKSSSLNVRSGPDTTYSIVGVLMEGDSLHIVDEQGDWLQIEAKQMKGWVANWLVEEKKSASPPKDSSAGRAYIKILNPGTNIRSGPQTSYEVVALAEAGETYSVAAKEGDWFRIRLKDGKTGYVAGWIVSAYGVPNVTRKGIEEVLKGQTILLDPGHGGNDSGAIGPHLGSLEKTANLKVSRLLAEKLKAAGAHVDLTRDNDRKISLQERVNMAVHKQADVFISIHHNTSENYRINGVITYFYSDGEDRELAGLIQKELIKKTGLNDLKARYGDYFVLRENPQLAVLCELGFLTNYQEEILLNTTEFQEQAAEGIFQGILKYYKEK